MECEKNLSMLLCVEASARDSRSWFTQRMAAMWHTAEVVELRSTSPGVQTARCPVGKVVSFGWRIHFTDAAGATARCVLDASGACPSGRPSCKQPACDTGGHDVRYIIIVCAVRESSPFTVTNQVSAVGALAQSSDCPEGMAVLFGFTTALSFGPRTPRECLQLATWMCESGATSCGAFECDAPDSLGMLYMLCDSEDQTTIEPGLAVFDSSADAPALAECPDDAQILFGFTWQLYDAANFNFLRAVAQTVPCLSTNWKSCRVGDTRCRAMTCGDAASDGTSLSLALIICADSTSATPAVEFTVAVPPGLHAVSARATNNLGVSSESEGLLLSTGSVTLPSDMYIKSVAPTGGAVEVKVRASRAAPCVMIPYVYGDFEVPHVPVLFAAQLPSV